MEWGRRLRALLDTHTFIWWLKDDPSLSSSARRTITNPDVEIYVSAATIWEIATKIRIGKLDPTPFQSGIEVEIRAENFSSLAVTPVHAEKAGYLDHKHKDPFDRMRKEGVRFVTAGENLALAQTLIMAHKGLMNSPGHRANILHKSFGRLGIGVLDGGIYGLMITQNFRN